MDVEDSQIAFIFILLFMYITSCYFIVKYLVDNLNVRLKLRHVFFINWIWGTIVFGLFSTVIHTGDWFSALLIGGLAALMATCGNEKFASSIKNDMKKQR